MLTEAASITRNDVLEAIQKASAVTGSDFRFLLNTAMRESGLKPQAKSGASSASGLFQFVEQTWLGLVKQHGAQYGLGSYASAISQDCDGHYSVDSHADRQAILALRNDPQVSSIMEGEYAKAARNSLQNSLGRDVCSGELYAAHFLGPASACRLIRMSESQPEASAPSEFPQAASANKTVFYHADGTAKSVREVYDWAMKQMNVSGLPESDTTKPDAKSGFHFAANATPDTSWLAGNLLPANGSAFSLTTLPRAPFVVTPNVIDMLGTLSIPAVSPAHQRYSA